MVELADKKDFKIVINICKNWKANMYIKRKREIIIENQTEF